MVTSPPSVPLPPWAVRVTTVPLTGLLPLSVSLTETALMVEPAVVLAGCCTKARLAAPAARLVSEKEAVPLAPEVTAVTV